MPEKTKIILIELDEEVGIRLSQMLERKHELTYVRTEEEASKHLVESRYDVCLLGSTNRMDDVLQSLQSMLCI